MRTVGLKKSSYFPRLHTRTHGYIDWSWDTDEIESFICAFDDPYDGASTFIEGRRVFLKSVRRDKGERGFHSFMSGLVYRKERGKIFVATKRGGIVISKVLNARGIDVLQEIELGQRLYTPYSYLEQARQFVAVYNARGLRHRKR